MDINAQLPVNTGIAVDDFCTILANLIDNAIESVVRERSAPEEELPVTIGKDRIRISNNSLYSEGCIQ